MTEETLTILSDIEEIKGDGNRVKKFRSTFQQLTHKDNYDCCKEMKKGS